MKTIGWLLVIGGIIMLAFSCERWKWRECKQVGHSTIYCLGKALK